MCRLFLESVLMHSRERKEGSEMEEVGLKEKVRDYLDTGHTEKEPQLWQLIVLMQIQIL